MLTKGPLSFSILADSVARHSKHSDYKEIADLSGVIFCGEDRKLLLVALSSFRENVKRSSVSFRHETTRLCMKKKPAVSRASAQH